MCFQGVNRPGSPGAGLSVRPVVPLEGAVPLWPSLQSPECLSRVRPDDPSGSLPNWDVVLPQMNSKKNLPKLTCSLAVPYLFSGLDRDGIYPCLALALLPRGGGGLCTLGGMHHLSHAAPVFWSQTQHIMIQIFISSLELLKSEILEWTELQKE